MKDKVRFYYAADRNVCVVTIKAKADGRKYMAVGSSKREPGDVYDPCIGRSLATARALDSLAVMMEADVIGQVAEAELAKQARLAERLQQVRGKVAKPSREKYTISEIRDKYGQDAADRAVARRYKSKQAG
jgi:hypothetical protein